jgi:hypothetical protein
VVHLSSRIHIVLATYNGARYLAEQLDSIEQQTEKDWTLLVMDDGSSDGTERIVAEAARRNARIRIEHRARPRESSAVGVFAELLGRSHLLGADYTLCCDQDDVWRPDKVAKTIARLKEAEGSDQEPALVHHDLEVVDQDLRPVAHSFWSLAALKPGNENNPQRLLSRNEVTGCALACNRALLEIALPIPEDAIMHDWWLALCAAYFGRLRPMQAQMVRYRQHEHNVIGAKSFWRALNPFTNWVAGWRRGNDEFLETVEQARAFQAAMQERLDPRRRPAIALNLYCQLPSLSKSERMKVLRMANIWRHNWLLDSVLAVRMLALPKRDD